MKTWVSEFKIDSPSPKDQKRKPHLVRNDLKNETRTEQRMREQNHKI